MTLKSPFKGVVIIIIFFLVFLFVEELGPNDLKSKLINRERNLCKQLHVFEVDVK